MNAPENSSLRAVQEELIRAELEGDADALDRMIADDFRGIDPRGAELDKAAVIAGYRRDDFQLETLRVDDVETRRFHDVGLVTGRSSMVGSAGGEPFEEEFRYRDVYVRRDGRWSLVASQLTPIQTGGET